MYLIELKSYKMKKFFGYALCLLFILSSCQSDTSKSENTPEEVVDENVYTRVDIMPRFSGCEDKPKEKRAACSSSKMFKYIRANIQYPAAAKEAGMEGRAVVSFVVDKSGKLRDIEVVKEPGVGMGAEAERIVKSFPDWIPGVHQGKKVHVQYIIPVTFKL